MSSSSMNSIYGLNRLRITGMNSGLDTEAIIGSIMKVEQMKVDKQFKNMKQKEMRRDQIREANKLINDFRYEFMTSTGGKGAKNVLAAMNFKGYKVTSDDTKNRAVITADPTAVAGTHTLDSVEQLATGGKMETLGNASRSGQGLSGTGFNLTHIGSELGMNLTFDENDEISFSINGEEFKFNRADTLQKVINTVNSSKAGVTMGYSQLTDVFTITGKETGAGAQFTATDNEGSSFLQAIGIQQSVPQGDPLVAATSSQGQDAIAYIDGIKVERSVNSFWIDGVNYNLKKTFNTDFDIGKDDGSGIGFEVSQDVDKAVGVIKDFVEGYNKLVASLTAMVQEAPNKEYLPLTDEERDALSESQLEKWEAESKKGMLYKDSNLNSLLSSMRNAFFQEIEGTGLSMAEIGIAPGSSVIDKVYVGTQQDVQIDEEKLRKALIENPDQVVQMFNGGGATSDDRMETAGIGNRLIKLGNGYKNTTSEIQTASLDYEIEKLDDKIESMKEKMTRQEELLYKKYAAMETALSKMQSQGNWFAQQFGGGA